MAKDKGKEISNIYIIARAEKYIKAYDKNQNESIVVNAGSIFLGRIGYYDTYQEKWNTNSLTILAKCDGAEIVDYKSNVSITLTDNPVCDLFNIEISHIHILTEPSYTLECALSIMKDIVIENAVFYGNSDDEEDETSDESETI